MEPFNPPQKRASLPAIVWDEEGETPTANSSKIEVLDVKLFGKWNPDEVQIVDTSLIDYVAVTKSHVVYLPHTAGRYANKRFKKAQYSIVECLTDSMKIYGRSNGTKLITVRIIPRSFKIIHLLTKENSL